MQCFLLLLHFKTWDMWKTHFVLRPERMNAFPLWFSKLCKPTKLLQQPDLYAFNQLLHPPQFNAMVHTHACTYLCQQFASSMYMHCSGSLGTHAYCLSCLRIGKHVVLTFRATAAWSARHAIHKTSKVTLHKVGIDVTPEPPHVTFKPRPSLFLHRDRPHTIISCACSQHVQ